MATQAKFMPTTLYRCYSKDTDGQEVLLYIGITSTRMTRLAQHTQNSYWWTHTTHVTIEHFNTREAAQAAEIQAIKTELPIYNVAHAIDRLHTAWSCEMCGERIVRNTGAIVHRPVQHQDWAVYHDKCDPYGSTTYRIRCESVDNYVTWLRVAMSLPAWVDEELAEAFEDCMVRTPKASWWI